MNIWALPTGKQENNSPVSKCKQTHKRRMEALFSSWVYWHGTSLLVRHIWHLQDQSKYSSTWAVSNMHMQPLSWAGQFLCPITPAAPEKWTWSIHKPQTSDFVDGECDCCPVVGPTMTAAGQRLFLSYNENAWAFTYLRRSPNVQSFCPKVLLLWWIETQTHITNIPI